MTMKNINWVKIFESIEEAKRRVPLYSVVPITIGNHQVCLGQLDDGFYAIDDMCPHQAASLGMGKCSPTGHVECPFHHYLFDLKTGANIGATSYDIQKYPVKIENNSLFIGIGI